MLKAREFTAHAPCHVTCKQGVKSDHIFGMPVAILHIHSLYNFYGATMTIKGSLQVKILYRGVFAEGTAEARISYGNSVCLSVRLSQPGGIPSSGEIEPPGLHHMVAWSI